MTGAGEMDKGGPSAYLCPMMRPILSCLLVLVLAIASAVTVGHSAGMGAAQTISAPVSAHDSPAAMHGCCQKPDGKALEAALCQVSCMIAGGLPAFVPQTLGQPVQAASAHALPGNQRLAGHQPALPERPPNPRPLSA